MLFGEWWYAPRGLGRGIVGGLKSLAGGNIEEWSAVCEEARREAFSRLVGQTREIGADAIIGMRYDATEFSRGATEVLPYGTAVRLANSAAPDYRLRCILVPSDPQARKPTHYI